MRLTGQFYDWTYILRCLISIALVMALMKGTAGVGFVVVVPLVYWALILRKTEALFFWLIVAECMLLANPRLVTKGAIFAWTQRGLMVSLGICMTISMLAYPKHKIMKPFLLMAVYIAFMTVSSLVGWCPMISAMKLLLFTVIYFSYFGVANQVGMTANVSSKKIRGVMLSLAIFFVLGSMALVPFPGLSQMDATDVAPEQLATMTSLFMGMTNQSQCLGPCISCISVVVFADLLFTIKRADKLYILILLCCPYLVFLTSSRTGMGSYLLGMMFVVFLFLQARGIRSRWKSRVVTSLMVGLTVAVAVIACTPRFSESVRKFLLKTQAGEDARVSVETVVSSRQALMDNALKNFKKSPFIGNGFQVSESMEGMEVNGLVLSAPIEKGVWITAILEEGGIIGFTIFVTFLGACILGSIKKRAYTAAGCMFVMSLANLGEFSYFSMSYTGGFEWAMVFVALALDVRKMRDEGEIRRQQMLQQQQMAFAMMGGPR